MTTSPRNSLSALVEELDALGIQLEAKDGQLLYHPREKVTPDLASRMKAVKADLLALVATRKTAGRLAEVAATWPADWREQWEERAAIMEYDGGLPRPLAEDRAYQLLLSALLAEQGVDYTPGHIPTADFLGIDIT